ncbi:MAG: isoprenylcysteine carboxylmethyltransferase family protein [Bryobacteraceae bacterium]|jgi:protein-S-isoprenylcysteine O-methyltransferase Ste14
MWSAGWIALRVWWLAWAWPFVFRAPHYQKRPSITAIGPTLAGLLLEVLAVAIAVALRLPPGHPPGLARILGSMVFGPIAVALSWTSVKHLGKQFRVNAGLYENHELVRTGPYAIVRHPIYSSVLAILLSTILLLTPWRWAAVSLALFVAGTEIRVRVEDRLLASRFGAEFEEYRKKVPAYVPFVR